MEGAIPSPADSYGMGPNLTDDGNDIIGKFNPVSARRTFDIDGSAKLIPKGSDFVFELHSQRSASHRGHHTRGAACSRRNPPKLRYYLSPGTPAADKSVYSERKTPTPRLCRSHYRDQSEACVSFSPHAHLRGKGFRDTDDLSDGEKETVFKGRFDFNWQLGLRPCKADRSAKGTRIVSIAHYDNSANNRSSGSHKGYTLGSAELDEMQSVFLGFIFDVKTDVSEVMTPSGPSLLPRQKTAGPTISALQ